jgi:hypothetical protein
LKNGGIVAQAILELLIVGIFLWLDRIRGWTLATFGLRPSWKWTGAGIGLFVSFQIVGQAIRMFRTGVLHQTVDFHRQIDLTLPFVLLISLLALLYHV